MMYQIIVCTILVTAMAEAPASSIVTGRLSTIVKEPALDECAVRGPGTPGGRKTFDYLVKQFRAFGLEL